jgi:Na+/proline symporter
VRGSPPPYWAAATATARERRRQLNPLVLGIAAYIALQFGIGLWVSRRIRTEDDYLVAGRSLGPALTTLTVFATWFGAETCVSAAGLAYAGGLSGASAEPFGYALCILVLGVFLAVPLWRMRLSTPADFYRIRYSPAVERLAVLLMVPTSVLWAAAQVRAFGHVLSAASGLEVEITTAIAALVVIGYTVVGGLLAVAWTDFVQGIALVVGLVVLGVAVLMSFGPESLGAIPPERLQLFGGGRPFLETLEVWAIPVLGSLTAAELITRVIAARSPGVARGATLAGGLAYLAVGLIPVTLGLVAGVMLPGVTEPEQVLPLLAERFLPPILYAVFAGALVSAILSTVDSALLVAGSLTSHNLVVPFFPGASDRTKVRVARVAVALFGIVAWAMATRAEAVFQLVEMASSFGSAGIVVVLVMGVFTRFGGSAAAIAALLAGITTWVLGAYVLEVPYPFLGSIAAAAGSYFFVGLLAMAGPLIRRSDPSPLP